MGVFQMPPGKLETSPAPLLALLALIFFAPICPFGIVLSWVGNNFAQSLFQLEWVDKFSEPTLACTNGKHFLSYEL